MTLTKRLTKGAPLDAAEFDANFEHVLDRANHTGEGNGGAEFPTFTAAVFVASIGDDDNPGTRADLPKLTLGGAMTAAAGLIAEGAPAVRVNVMDGGTYTEAEQLVIPANVHVTAPAARFVGTVAVAANASFTVDKHFAPANGANMVQHEGGSDGAAIYAANICDGRGVGGALTGVNNIRNVGGGGKNLFVRPGILYVGASGIGVGDVSSGNAGHIHCLIPDLYLAGNGAVGILGSSQGQGASNIVGFIDHILEIDSPTGTVGIRLNAAAAAVKLMVAEIIADTAWDITAGDLYIGCPRVVGTKTGAPANRLLDLSDLPL